MRSWKRSASILFLAAAAVYTGGAVEGIGTTAARAAGQESSPPTQVRLLSDQAAPSATGDSLVAAAATALPSAAASSDTAAEAAPAATTAPADKGASVTSSQVSVGPAGTIEIHVSNVNLVELLRMLSAQTDKNIIPTKGVSGTVSANLYDVTLPEALDAILKANGYGYVKEGNITYVYPEDKLKAMQKAERKVKTEIFPLYYIPASDAATLIKPVLSTESRIQLTLPAKSGIASDASDAGGDNHAGDDMLVVSDYPENLQKVRDLLKQIDRRPQQVLVEATMLAVNLDESNQLGVNFTVLGGVDFSTLSNVGSAGTGSGLSQALSGGGVGSPANPAITQNSAGNSVNDSGFIAGQFGGNGLQVGVVKNNIGMFIQALESVTNTTVLANPKVLVLNKQRGEVHVGSQIGYQNTSTQTETANTSTVAFFDTGIRLIFRPYIGEDGWIRMEIHPENSSPITNPFGDQPAKQTTDVTTNIMVQNNHTIVIGGLFQEISSISKNQVPLLGDLPLVGPLFRSQTDTTHRQEVIILLTPHIINDADAYAQASQKVLEDAEKLRVGVRKGMMPWGSERLAESAYENAVAELNKSTPDTKKAIWYLNCATNLNPTFLEAINLKQSLTGHVVEDADNSAVRNFVRDQMMRSTKPATTRPSTLGMKAADMHEVVAGTE